VCIDRERMGVWKGRGLLFRTLEIIDVMLLKE
jgi:hypothetical protein